MMRREGEALVEEQFEAEEPRSTVVVYPVAIWPNRLNAKQAARDLLWKPSHEAARKWWVDHLIVVGNRLRTRRIPQDAIEAALRDYAEAVRVEFRALKNGETK